MNAKEKYYDRRHSERKGNTRRGCERLNCSFEISIPGHNGKTVNVSASGVYFEVVTNDMEVFSPGATIPLQIVVLTHTNEDRDNQLVISGRGKVLRNCIIERPDHANSLEVALEFTEKLTTY